MANQKIDYKEIEALLEKELDENAIRVEEVNILFLDVSSTCVGYSIATVDFTNKKAKVTSAGALWFGSKWKHQEKYSYMFNAIVNYFWIVKKIDHIVVEQYSVNPKKMMGVNVVPEMQGAIKCAAQENGVNVTSILPQTWRSILGIKASITLDKKGKKVREYKEPTKIEVKKYTKVPVKITSNITKNERTAPSDIYDALAIDIAWLKRAGFKIDCKNVKFNDHIGCINE